MYVRALSIMYVGVYGVFDSKLLDLGNRCP